MIQKVSHRIIGLMLALSLCLLVILGGSKVIGYSIVLGMGDSMEPMFDNCDVIILDTTSDSPKDLQSGDVIAYRSNNNLIIHETIAIRRGSTGWIKSNYVYTKGVNMPHRDRVKVKSEMIVGKVIDHLNASIVCSIPRLLGVGPEE